LITEEEKFDVLSKVKGNLNPADFSNEITKSTIESIQAIKVIQKIMENWCKPDIY
jgi:phosphoenolpyruvate carboxylase